MAFVTKDARDLFHATRAAYAKTPTRLKIIDMYVVYSLITALIQVVYMAIVGTFPFNAFLSGVLSCIGTSVLGICLRMQVNPVNKEFKVRAPHYLHAAMFYVRKSCQWLFLVGWLFQYC
jgi:oligosaccharyltransferase complex subunit epsilon